MEAVNVMKINYKYSYMCCMNYCVYVNSYKYGDDANFEVMSDKFNINRICTLIIIIIIIIIIICNIFTIASNNKQ
jgi:hypothetical protein